MSDPEESDVLAEEHASDEDGAWLDIHLPALVHAQLAVFGRRVGLTADGYAKLLIFQALHPLVAAEPALAEAGDLSQPPDDLELWRVQLQAYEGREDEAPAPREVQDAFRTFHADDFSWPGDVKPSCPWARIDQTGRLAVSATEPQAAQPTGLGP